MTATPTLQAELRAARAVAVTTARAAGCRRAAGAAALRRRRRGRPAAIEASLPDAVGAFVDWLVRESGWTVTERGGAERRAVQPRHVCLLFRRFVSFGTDVTRPYVDALEARGIPHLLVGGKASTTARRSRRCAPRWRPSSGPTTSCRSSRRCAARSSPSATRRCSSTGTRTAPFHPFRVPERRCPGTSRPSARRWRCCATLHRGRNRRPVAETVARCSRPRARTSASRCGPPASRRSPTCCTWPSWRASTRWARAASRSAASSSAARGERARRRRGADRRGGQRRRAADDRAQGQGARVPRRRARRHHREARAAGGARHLDAAAEGIRLAYVAATGHARATRRLLVG
jgi:hypothetical protein